MLKNKFLITFISRDTWVEVIKEKSQFSFTPTPIQSRDERKLFNPAETYIYIYIYLIYFLHLAIMLQFSSFSNNNFFLPPLSRFFSFLFLIILYKSLFPNSYYKNPLNSLWFSFARASAIGVSTYPFHQMIYRL